MEIERGGQIQIKLQRKVQQNPTTGSRKQAGIQDAGMVLSLQELEKEEERNRFQKEDGQCGLKVPKGHPEDVLSYLSGIMGLERNVGPEIQK